MKNLFEPAQAAELQARLSALRAESPRGWGKMTQSQMLAHCSVVMEMAVGDTRPTRSLIGRVIGQLVLRKVTADDKPLGRNSPTAKEMVIADQRDFDPERTRLRTLIDRFTTGGATRCTTHPHTFFGPMTPQQWSVLMYKHIDHHLRQFGA